MNNYTLTVCTAHKGVLDGIARLLVSHFLSHSATETMKEIINSNNINGDGFGFRGRLNQGPFYYFPAHLSIPSPQAQLKTNCDEIWNTSMLIQPNGVKTQGLKSLNIFKYINIRVKFNSMISWVHTYKYIYINPLNYNLVCSHSERHVKMCQNVSQKFILWKIWK